MSAEAGEAGAGAGAPVPDTAGPLVARGPFRGLPTTVVALGVVSLLTDLSSEMISPLLPLFLTTTLGAGAVALGAIEGVAEATASLVKLVSGAWSDRTARRKPWLVVGYTLAGVARPLIGAAAHWPAVLALRFADRVGKGLRTAPRDALIGDVTPERRRGAAFGLHRGMDHAGAVIGPLAGAGLIAAGLSLPAVFYLAAVPAAATLAVLVFAVREPRREVAGRREVSPSAATGRPRPPRLRDWRRLGPGLHRFVAARFLFTLGSSTDAFLLLRMSEAGVGAAAIAALWAALHVVKLLATVAGGQLSDRLGRRPLMLAGWAVYAAVYAGFALFDSAPAFVALLLVYGLYFGLTEPVERAWVTDLAPPVLRGTALGAFHAAVGVAALPASLVFGLLWSRFGAPVAFAVGAGLAMAAGAMLLAVPERTAARA
ncbi:MAG TPA: MFS transporter [Thermoanaerobaculia bacterium]|nr:MFS transporter [Thermoanaerobaculia bacterium]